MLDDPLVMLDDPLVLNKRVRIAAQRAASFKSSLALTQASSIAATTSPKAKQAVNPGDSMPKRFTTPCMP